MPLTPDSSLVRRARASIVGIATVVAVLAAGCSSSGGEGSSPGGEGNGAGSTNTITGRINVEIYDQMINQIAVGSLCRMGPKYQPGTQVVVKGGGVETIAVGELAGGDATGLIESGANAGLAKYCSFDVTIDDVPHSDFYELLIGDRTVLTTSHENLAADDWVIDASMSPR